MKTIISSILVAFSSAVALAPNYGQASESHLPEIKAEILQGWARADGRMIGALHITMGEGWKTYWRAPGDGGIPPQMDWSRSRNLTGLSALWPAPEVFHDNGMTSFGFEDQLLLPLVITPRKNTESVRLKGSLQIGLCKEICIPYELEVSGALNPAKTTIVAPIAAAMAAQPFSAGEAKVGNVSCRLTPSQNGMAVSAKIDMPSAGGREYAVIETGNPRLWVQEASVKRNGREISVSSDVVHVEQSPFFLQRSDITITVIGTDYAVEIQGCQAG